MSKDALSTPRMPPLGLAAMVPAGLLALIHEGRDTIRRILVGDTDRTRTQRAALSAFAIRIMSAAIAYLSQVVLARWMGSFEYGAFVFVWVWVLILGGVSSLGLNIAMMRFVPDYRAKGDFDALRGLLMGGRLFVLTTSTCIAGLGLAGLAFLLLALGQSLRHAGLSGTLLHPRIRLDRYPGWHRPCPSMDRRRPVPTLYPAPPVDPGRNDRGPSAPVTDDCHDSSGCRHRCELDHRARAISPAATPFERRDPKRTAHLSVRLLAQDGVADPDDHGL